MDNEDSNHVRSRFTAYRTNGVAFVLCVARSLAHRR